MNRKERERLVVFNRVRDKELSRAAAAQVLGLSLRQVHRLYLRFVAQGDKGLVHKARGKPSARKIVQADVTYVDLPAPPASSEGHVGTEDLPAEHLARLRDSDALLHVVRAFEDASNPHPEGSVDPARDLDRLDTEFLLADLALVDRRLERLATSGRHGTPAEREANEREEAILVRLKAALEAGSPIRTP